ncbi:MAG: hypothetical protein ACFB6R_11725, partial [Alphaproteobacteria bacterium]
KTKTGRAPADARIKQALRGTDPAQTGSVIMAAVGGTPTGETGSFAGHDCRYYRNDAIGTTACVTDWGATLHLTVKLGKIEIDRRADDIRLGDAGPASAYAK